MLDDLLITFSQLGRMARELGEIDDELEREDERRLCELCKRDYCEGESV